MTRILITAIAALTLGATGAMAKGHSQNNTEVPGKNVKAETVTSAQGLGSTRGNRPADKGPNAE